MKYVLRSINSEQIFTLDVTQDYSESHKATVTKHPVEEGSPLSDHIFLDNPSMSIKGVITDYDAGDGSHIDLSSFNQSNLFQDIVGLFQNAVDLTTGADALTIENTVSSRTIEFAKALKLAMYGRHIFSLFIKDDKTDEILDHYNTVAIEDLTFSRSVGGGSGMMEVNMKLVQIRTARIKRTEISQAEKDTLDKSVDQQAKANATKSASSGKTGGKASGTKKSKGKGDGDFSAASASAAFDSGADEGANAGSDRLGVITGKVQALGSQTHVLRQDAQKQVEAERNKHFGK